jgi:hypothetical protein
VGRPKTDEMAAAELKTNFTAVRRWKREMWGWSPAARPVSGESVWLFDCWVASFKAL